MTDSDKGLYERDLTPAEIEERTALALQLLGERDDNLADVDQRRREIRSLNRDRKKLELRTAQIRLEIRTGKVLEQRQVKLAFGVEPTDPDPFEKLFPQALTAERLHRDLSIVLQGVLVPSIEALEQWHPSIGIFQGIAHWARVELAYMNAKEHPELELPPRGRMPDKLAEVRAELQRAAEEREGKRRPAKKRAARAAKVRPASGTPIRRGVGRRAAKGVRS